MKYDEATLAAEEQIDRAARVEQLADTARATQRRLVEEQVQRIHGLVTNALAPKDKQQEERHAQKPERSWFQTAKAYATQLQPWKEAAAAIAKRIAQLTGRDERVTDLLRPGYGGQRSPGDVIAQRRAEVLQPALFVEEKYAQQLQHQQTWAQQKHDQAGEEERRQQARDAWRGTITEAIEVVRRRYGPDVQLASANSLADRGLPVRVHPAWEVAQFAEQAREQSGVKEQLPVYAVGRDGTIRNTVTGRDEWLALTKDALAARPELEQRLQRDAKDVDIAQERSHRRGGPSI